MPEITVTASPLDETSYNVLDASTATKTDTPIMETPFSIQVVPQQVLRDQQAIRLSDALKNVSGVQSFFAFSQQTEQFTLRGFNVGFEGRLFRDGVRVEPNISSLANAERVEVLKGPASVLYGRLDPGGLINIVTKRPLANPYYALEQQFGSFNTYRTTLDATGPITQDGTLAYRLNFEYLNQDSFRDLIAADRIFVAPSLTWRLSGRTQIDLDFIYQDQDSANDNGIVAIGNRPAPIPIERNLAEEEINRSNSKNYDTALTLTHEFNQDWKLRGRFQAQLSDGVFGTADPVSLDEATGTLERSAYTADVNSEAYFGTVDITGRVTTWGLVHSVLVGADYYDATYDERGVELDRTRFARPIPINIFNPVYGTVPEFRGEPLTYINRQDDSWWGVYVQDQIQLGDQWHVLLGFRYDDAEAVQNCCPPPEPPVDAPTIKAQEFSPRFGLLYHPLPWLALYGSYAEGFGGVNDGVTADGSPPGSQLSQQYEAGVKAEGFDGRLTGSLAFFDLTKTNIETPVPGRPNIVEVAGEARNRGIEFDVSGALTEHWRLIASYSYIDSEITKDRDEEGGTGNQGNRLGNAPRHAGSLWTHYEFTQFGWPGLTAGIGAFFVGQREGDNANSFQLPGYGRADAALGYSWRIGPSKVTAQFNVENLLDKEYFLTSFDRVFIQPGAPRTFLGSIRIAF